MDQKQSSRVNWKLNIIKTMGGKCQCCGYNNYYGALELHHLNANEKNFSISDKTYRSWDIIENELKKCVLLCANCHREVEAGLKSIKESSFNQQEYDNIKQEINIKKEKTINNCPMCGKQIWSSSNYCKDCADKLKRKVERPSREELKKLIRAIPFTKIGNLYGVSDNTIRKWCQKENLPSKSSIIKSYNNEEWNKL